MKRFVTSLGASLALTLAVLAPAVSADSRYWQLEMYQPTAGTTAHTVNVEWKVLSTVKTDNMTVSLFEGANSVATAAPTTKDYGDSGIFSRTLADGTYTFHVEATNSGDPGVTKATDPETFTVTTAPSGGTTVVFVNNGSGGRGGNESTAGTGTTTGTGSQVLGTQTTGTGGTTGTTGNVNAPGSSKTGNNNDNGKVLGVETTNNHNTRNVWIASVAAGLAILLALYYLLARRASTNR